MPLKPHTLLFRPLAHRHSNVVHPNTPQAGATNAFLNEYEQLYQSCVKRLKADLHVCSAGVELLADRTH